MKVIQSQIENLRRKPNELQAFYSELETNLRILGVTGVEDQLQDFVPETLEALKEAGIRVWMLTGDKMETAVNIGISCGLAPKSGLTTKYGKSTSTEIITDCSDLENLTKNLHRIQ